jgi:hypothetical protein
MRGRRDQSARPGERGRCNCTELRKASRRISQLYDMVLTSSGRNQGVVWTDFTVEQHDAAHRSIERHGITFPGTVTSFVAELSLAR